MCRCPLLLRPPRPQIRRPGYWTVHPTFSNNVRVTGNSIVTYGSNTDGCDPDSSWNVYIAENTFSTGDDCIAIKAGTIAHFDPGV